MDLKPCSSHMPVLMDLLKTFNFPNIVEFGSGLFSTNLFLGHTSSFTSVETNHEWMETVQQRFLGRTWKYVWAPDLPALLAEVRPCDLIFVDGHFRQEITQKAFTCAPVIVCHDSQYEWTFQLKVPPEFRRLDFMKFPFIYPNHEAGVRDDRPWTTIFSSRPEVLSHFADREKELYTKYVFPYGINLSFQDTLATRQPPATAAPANSALERLQDYFDRSEAQAVSPQRQIEKPPTTRKQNAKL